jgi:hypothetical protein
MAGEDAVRHAGLGEAVVEFQVGEDPRQVICQSVAARHAPGPSSTPSTGTDFGFYARRVQRDHAMSTVSDSEAVSDRTQAPRIRRQRLGVSFQIVEPLVAVADAALIVGSSVIGGAAYRIAVQNPIDDLATYVAYGLVGSIAYALAAHRSELYRLQRLLQRRRDYPWVAASCLWAVLVVSVVLFLLKRGADVSRGSVISFSVLGSITFLSWRATFKNWLRRAIACGAVHGRRIVMLGTEKELAAVHRGELMSLCGLDEMGRVLLPQNDCSE